MYDAASVRFVRTPLSSSVVQELFGRLNAGALLVYPREESHHWRVDEDEFAPGNGVLLVGYLGERPVACGGVRRCEPGADVLPAAELKRMFVEPDVRRHGIGAALVAALEAEARSLGVVRLLLETGVLLLPAVRLYERCGFSAVPAYGEYIGSPDSYCMGKRL